MSKENQILSLDDLPIQRQAIQLPNGEVIDCFKSKEGDWYYQVPALDEQGNPLIDEDDDEVLEKVRLAA